MLVVVTAVIHALYHRSDPFEMAPTPIFFLDHIFATVTETFACSLQCGLSIALQETCCCCCCKDDQC